MSFLQGPPSSIPVVSFSQAGSKTLTEGSTVFVRVLAFEGSGRYTVSFAGQRFSVFSRSALPPGTSFRADVRMENGRILLVPRREPAFSDSAGNSVKRFSSLNADSSGKLFSFLQQLGLPADSLSFRLVQFFQENGVQFNSRFALKARSLAKRFKGYEDDAAEAALFLLQKGIEPDEKSIMYVLSLLYGTCGDDTNNKGGEFLHEFSAFSLSDIENTIVSHLYEKPEHIVSLPPGLLSFLNHTKTSEKHWIFLPFEYCIGDKVFSGVIRVFLNLEQKKAEKAVISAFTPITNYLFMLYFKHQTNQKEKLGIHIDYCISPAVSESKTARLNRLLNELLSAIAETEVCYRQDLFDSGGFTGMPDLSFVEARA
ncbi:hypothetical protein H0R92_08300 [Treponema sp. OMZ 840]|uniref:hypothetical protein n=1 Tax=Treponema sp. OMZ 840 TaxID=244313 RepID=UPI003D922804